MSIVVHDHRHYHDRGFYRRTWHSHVHRHAPGRPQPADKGPFRSDPRPSARTHAHGHRG